MKVNSNGTVSQYGTNWKAYANQWVPLMPNGNPQWKTFRYQDIFGGQNYIIYNSKTQKLETYYCTQSTNKNSYKELKSFETNKTVFNFDDFLCFCDVTEVFLTCNRELIVGSNYLIDIKTSEKSEKIKEFSIIAQYIGNEKFKLNTGTEIGFELVDAYIKIPEIPFKFIMNQCLREMQNE